MANEQGEQVGEFLDASLEKATRIEQAFGHLARAVELQLVDVALDPSLANNSNRERFVALGQRIADLSGIGYELLTDISAATGISLQPDQEGAATELPPSTATTPRGLLNSAASRRGESDERHGEAKPTEQEKPQEEQGPPELYNWKA